MLRNFYFGDKTPRSRSVSCLVEERGRDQTDEEKDDDDEGVKEE